MIVKCVPPIDQTESFSKNEGTGLSLEETISAGRDLIEQTLLLDIGCEPGKVDILMDSLRAPAAPFDLWIDTSMSYSGVTGDSEGGRMDWEFVVLFVKKGNERKPMRVDIFYTGRIFLSDELKDYSKTHRKTLVGRDGSAKSYRKALHEKIWPIEEKRNC